MVQERQLYVMGRCRETSPWIQTPNAHETKQMLIQLRSIQSEHAVHVRAEWNRKRLINEHRCGICPLLISHSK